MTAQGLASELREIAQASWKGLLGLGVVSILLGIAILVWPGQSTVVIAILLGIYLLISGIAQLAVGIAAPLSIGTRILVLLAAVASIMLGFVAFSDKWRSVALLGLWIGVGWIFAGVSRLTAGLMGHFPGRGWSILDGVILLIGGVILLESPITSAATLVWVSGCFLIGLGVVEAIHGFMLRKVVNPA